MRLLDKKVRKVVLVNPNFITKSITDTFTIPALGLEYLAAYITDIVDVILIDAKVRNLNVNEIMEEIDEFKPDLVGISCCYTIGVNFALRIAQESKERNYLVVMGGWHPTFAENEIISYSFIDVVVRGEGEITFRELIQNNELESIKGITYKINGHIYRNPDRPLIKDLNTLPLPASQLRSKNSYFQIFQLPFDVIETSRGCPHKCTFCNIHLFNRGKYRMKSAERVVHELKIISQQKRHTNVFIVDDNFTANMKRVEKICDLLIEQGIKLDLTCQSRIDVIKKHPEVIKKMAKAGFWLFFLGIESFNQDSLNDIQKKVQLKDIFEAIRIIHENNIVIIGSLLVGSRLDEKEGDIDVTIKVVKKLGIDFPLYSVMTPLPGTKFREMLIEKDYLLTYNWSEYNFTTAVNRLDNLSKEKLEQLLSKAYYYGYFKRGWMKTIFRLFKNKGFRFLLNPRSVNAVRDFANFFFNIRRMKDGFDSESTESITHKIKTFQG